MTSPSRIVPTANTRRLAARIVRLAGNEGADAARLVAEIERGQEAALVGALACLAARNNRPTPGRPATTLPFPAPTELDLIACPRCQALIHEPCRTEGGWSRVDHAERLMPRRCPCGAPIPRKRGRDLCDDCRTSRRRQQINAAVRKHRERKRAMLREAS